MGLLDRISTRKIEPESAAVVTAAVDDPVFSTKALRKFLACLRSNESAALIDLGAVVGSNVTFFGEQLGCKIFVQDILADLDRLIREGRPEAMPALLRTRFSEKSSSIDGILCWDVFDYLDRPSARALADELTRVLRPEGALLGFFGTAQPRERGYTKYIVVDETTLRHRSYAAARGRQSALANRDIIQLFSTLRVSDSFLLQNNLREILFRKPVWEGQK
jgi:hypothetical protein